MYLEKETLLKKYYDLGYKLVWWLLIYNLLPLFLLLLIYVLPRL
jgi:hypothetical protein